MVTGVCCSPVGDLGAEPLAQHRWDLLWDSPVSPAVREILVAEG